MNLIFMYGVLPLYEIVTHIKHSHSIKWSPILYEIVTHIKHSHSIKWSPI
jgi:hypothetical protein